MKATKLALEGLVHSGKTTVLEMLSKLDKRIQCIGEYVIYTKRGGRGFPGFPNNSKMAQTANFFFLDLDRKRFGTTETRRQVIIFDRSLLSVLAYHFATEKLSKKRIKCFESSLTLFRKRFPFFLPGVAIYLDVSDDTIRRRHEFESGYYEQVLLNAEFNGYLRYFYNNLTTYFPEIDLFKVCADNSKEAVFSEVREIVGKYLR